MVATSVRPCTPPRVTATRQHRETSSPGVAGSRPCVAHCAGSDSLRSARRPRAVPVLGAVPGPGDTAGRARACGAGQPAKAPLRRQTFKWTPNDQKEAKRSRAGGGEGTRSAGAEPPFTEREREMETPTAAGVSGQGTVGAIRVPARVSSTCALRRASCDSVPTLYRFAPYGAMWLFLE